MLSIDTKRNDYLELEMGGTIRPEDVERIAPQIGEMYLRHDKLRALIRVREPIEGSIRELLRGLMFGVQERTSFSRIAILGSQDELPFGSDSLRAKLSEQVRYFDPRVGESPARLWLDSPLPPRHEGHRYSN